MSARTSEQPEVKKPRWKFNMNISRLWHWYEVRKIRKQLEEVRRYEETVRDYRQTE